MTSLSGRFEGRRHLLPVRVYYEDTDSGGVVYHASYLRFAERARSELLRLVGINQSELLRRDGLAFAVRSAHLDFHGAARLDDLLEVGSRLTALRGASIETEQVISRDGRALVQVDVRIACLGPQGRPARLPAALREAMEPYCHRREQT